MPDFDDDAFPLTKLIDALGRQLDQGKRQADRAASSGRPSPIAWSTAQIEVGVTWTTSGSGEIDVKVLRLGGERTKENTATMTVTLVPAGGEPVLTVTTPDWDSEPRP
jgi:hypothetical protein